MTALAYANDGLEPRVAQGPTSREAEEALIGILINDAAQLQSLDGLQAGHFAEPFLAFTFNVIGKAVAEDRPVDPITLREDFRSAPDHDDATTYLLRLWDQAPPSSNAQSYARTIMDLSLRRELIRVSREAAEQAATSDRPAADLVSDLRTETERLELEAAPDDSTLQRADEAADDVLDALDDELANGRPRGAMTGLRCFDRRLGGLKPGWLVVVGARPSMGKTALARAAAEGCANRNPGQSVAFFAIEMEKREIIERSLSALSHETHDGIAYQEIGNGKVTPMEMRRLRELRARVPSNLLIDDRSVLSLEDVRRRVFALKRKGPVAAVFIDYLQLMVMPPANGRNDAARWGEVTSGLKRLAREARTCVVLLSQLNRALESREDKRPQLSDLRDSGSIEQDANAVLFPFREFYYAERSPPKEDAPDEVRKAWETRCELLRRKLEVGCGKVRQGAVGTDQQVYFAEYDFIEDAPLGGYQ